MKDYRPVAALVLVLGAFVGALALLFHWRVQRGDVFPPYSSLRADEVGTKALRDALAALPGISGESRTAALASLATVPDRTLILAGIRRSEWTDLDPDSIDALDAAIRAGGRLVLGFAPEPPPPSEAPWMQKAREEAPAEKKGPVVRARVVPAGLAVIRRRWGIALDKAGPTATDLKFVKLGADGAAGLPRTLPWDGALAFEAAEGSGWRVVYSGGGRPAVLERSLGAGSIVVLGDSFLLTNEALRRSRQPEFLSWLVGSGHRVVFDETHLGVAQRSGAATLARRYRLGAAALTLALVAALYAWQQAANFLPSEEESRDIILRYHPAEALQALLKRSIPPAGLTRACVDEWKQTARRPDWPRVDEAVRGAPDPVSAYNAATRALRRRSPPP
ncbi:MAG TPA: DUF4350 domain-containing protein [Opitutaceae bacterium]|jgi:hypothetical protein